MPMGRTPMGRTAGTMGSFFDLDGEVPIKPTAGDCFASFDAVAGVAAFSSGRFASIRPEMPHIKHSNNPHGFWGKVHALHHQDSGGFKSIATGRRRSRLRRDRDKPKRRCSHRLGHERLSHIIHAPPEGCSSCRLCRDLLLLLLWDGGDDNIDDDDDNRVGHRRSQQRQRIPTARLRMAACMATMTATTAVATVVITTVTRATQQSTCNLDMRAKSTATKGRRAGKAPTGGASRTRPFRRRRHHNNDDDNKNEGGGGLETGRGGGTVDGAGGGVDLRGGLYRTRRRRQRPPADPTQDRKISLD
ncbi:hypothetical protein ACHAXA_011482 [Cyclostephanos tholiformis]|uniref:Uncharacterized protein n=1 Tax=Cyclostephanos tholiformis TaxID=382380 RepID=A0ABD3SE74_9STRA